jgi:hypothetical protein
MNDQNTLKQLKQWKEEAQTLGVPYVCKNCKRYGRIMPGHESYTEFMKFVDAGHEGVVTEFCENCHGSYVLPKLPENTPE